ncbi:hypothetical protein D3C87_1299750 [compost metagenome]
MRSILRLDEPDKVGFPCHVLHLAPNVPEPKALIRRDGQSYCGGVLCLQGDGSGNSEGPHGLVSFQDRLEDVVSWGTFLKLTECPRLKSHPA